MSISLLFCSLTISANAELIDRGGGLIYDTDLDITWLQDANYAKTSGYDEDGRMNWWNTMIWAQNFVYQGYIDWRLPTTLQPDLGCSFQEPVSFGYNCTGSEMGHLYYTELGNIAGFLSNSDLFINLRSYWYWSSTDYYPDSNYAMGFSFHDILSSTLNESGYQATPYKSANGLYAWAVRDGDSLPMADIDDDGDGYTENQGDCDDTDPTVSPNASEICDGVDNNCNNIIDDVSDYGNYTITQLSDNSDNDEGPYLNNIGDVVWSGHDGNDFEIYLYNGATVTQITNNFYDDRNPQINDSGNIVWDGYDGNDYEIFYYNGLTITQITNTVFDCKWPQINVNGEIVWHCFDGNDYEIFYYDGTVNQLTNNSIHELSPDINSFGWITWHKWDGNDYEIILYNGITELQITDNTWDDLASQLNDSGEVVWYGYEGGSNYYGPTDAEIFLYNGTDVVQVTNNSVHDFHPVINKDGLVAWNGSDGNDDEIFQYFAGIITQITSNSLGDSEVQLNDEESMVWYGNDGNDLEIFLATPVIPEDIDNDCDGYTENQGDCDDTDPEVNLGMTEIPYNGKDDDCNAITLDDDLDGDGYGITTDCNDNDPSIYPDAPEIKHDGIDQDCNGYDLTIDIIKAHYKKDKLRVEATSSLGETANLILQDFGPMKAKKWRASLVKWVIKVKNVGGDPGTATVCGIEGCDSVKITIK